MVIIVGLLFAGLVAALGCPNPPSPVPLSVFNSSSPYPAYFASAIQVAKQLFNETGIYDGSFAFVYKGDILAQYSIGQGVTIDTPFRSGSITKAFSVAEMFLARDMGLLNGGIDSPVYNSVKKFVVDSPYISDQSKNGITWHSLAAQMSGLQGGTPCDFLQFSEPFLWNACNISNDEAWKRIREQKQQVFPMFHMPLYADVAFEIMGRAIEEITGVLYEDWMQKYIFNPLNMTNTFFFLTPERAKQVPPGYAGSVQLPNWLSNYPMNWANPTGGAYTSTRDLARFASLWLSDFEERAQNPLGMQAQTLYEMMLPAFWNSDGVTGFGTPFELLLLPIGSGYLIKSKTGMQPGYSASMFIFEEIQAAIVYTGNLGSPTDFMFQSASALIPAFEQVLRDNEQAPFAPSNLTSFVGTYVANLWLGAVSFSTEISVVSEAVLFVNITSSMIATSSANMVALNATWNGDNSLILNPPPDASTCFFAGEFEYANSILYFQTKGTKVLSFTMQSTEPFYGTVFNKVN